MYRGRFIPGDEICSAAMPDSDENHPQTGTRGAPHATSSHYTRAAAEKRIACILVADFPVAAIARTNPELRERPFALIRMPSAPGVQRAGRKAEFQPHSEISHVSSLARAAGLRAGMTVAHARALIPGLIVRHPSPAAERASADSLVDVAESISPVVEEDSPGCVWLDLTGSARFYRHSLGSGDPAYDLENSMAEELMRRAGRVGLEAAVGIASSKETAYLAARCGGARVIALDREREFLDWMPLDLLNLGANDRGDDVELMLKRLGIRRLGDIARLDSCAVGSRLGNRGVELARLARGESSSNLIARPRPETFTEAAEVEYGIENLEALSFVMRAMLTQLTERLQLRGLVAGDMTLSLELADRCRDGRLITVAAPTIEVRSLLTLINLNLEASPPIAAVETIRLTIEPRHPRPAQADMFLPPSPAPDRLEAAVARIAALCGPDRVGMLTGANSYRPEAARLGAFAPPLATSVHENATIGNETAGGDNVVRMVLRTIRPAEEVEVLCTREMPTFVRGSTICARVVSAAGPWRRQGEWWTVAADTHAIDSAAASWQSHAPAAYARDYYELALEDGVVYRVYCNLYSGKWFVDGIYD
jgi:protein ImuB